jgi:hypothetical protein
MHLSPKSPPGRSFRGKRLIDGDDTFGDGVNLAARLETLAEPGGVCVSRVVRDQVRDKLDFAFEDMGEQQVKNIARPIHVYRVQARAAAPEPKPANGRFFFDATGRPPGHEGRFRVDPPRSGVRARRS